MVTDAGAQHLFKGLVSPLACPAVQVHALQAKPDGLLLVLPVLSGERSISNNLSTHHAVCPPACSTWESLSGSCTGRGSIGWGTARLQYLNEVQDVPEDGVLLPSVCLGSVLVALSSQDLELGTQELCILVVQVFLPNNQGDLEKTKLQALPTTAITTKGLEDHWGSFPA